MKAPCPYSCPCPCPSLSLHPPPPPPPPPLVCDQEASRGIGRKKGIGQGEGVEEGVGRKRASGRGRWTICVKWYIYPFLHLDIVHLREGVDGDMEGKVNHFLWYICQFLHHIQLAEGEQEGEREREGLRTNPPLPSPSLPLPLPAPPSLFNQLWYPLSISLGTPCLSLCTMSWWRNQQIYH